MESNGRETQERARDRQDSPSAPRVFGEDSANASRETNAGAAPISRAAAVCIAMKAEGMVDVSSSHPDLLELLEGGAEIGEFVDAARRAVADRKRFPYALGIVRGQREDAKRRANSAAAPSGGKRRYVPAPTVEQMEADMKAGLRDESGTWLGPRTEDGMPDYARAAAEPRRASA